MKRLGILTSGGDCAGLNAAIRAVMLHAREAYGAEVIGIRNGTEGLLARPPLASILTGETFDGALLRRAGTVLGSISTGSPFAYPMPDGSIGDRTAEIAEGYRLLGLDGLVVIGGDGSFAIMDRIARETGIKVIGIPKTIDNDLHFIGRSFGFETAVYTTNEIITSAHVEARGAYNGIGLVKLMGRDSGFIAAYASMANSVVNFCLVPEVPFTMEGEHGLLKALERRFEEGKTHCVIVVAEGAGQELMKEEEEERRDKSGNLLKKDIGLFLRERIEEHFKAIDIPASMKYFDPSYQIRSVPALGTDAILCHMLAQNAVHAAMAGRTDCVIGNRHNIFSHVPIPLAATERQKLETQKALWRAVLAATRQNDYFNLHDCA
jgi:6-phosphofructokinase 1